MSSAFDPYSEWLGIPRLGFHPDRYRLLGLEPFTDDPGVIAAAAAAQRARLQPHVAGPQAAAAAKLLDELELARSCLLDPAKKRTYDNLLRQQLASRPAQATVQAAPPPVVAGPTTPDTDGDIDDLLPPAAVLPPQAVPLPATPPAWPPQAVPVQAMPAQAVPLAAAPAWPSAVPMAQGYPVQAVPLAAQAVPAQPYAMPVAATAYPAPAYAEPVYATPAYPSAAYGGPAVAMAVPVADDAGTAPLAEPAMPLSSSPSGASSTLRMARKRRQSAGLITAFAGTAALVVVLGVTGWVGYTKGWFGKPTEPDDAVAIGPRDRRPRPAATPYRSPGLPDVVVPPQRAPIERPATDTPSELDPVDPDPEMSMPDGSMEDDPETMTPDPEPDPEPTPEPTPDPEPTPEPTPEPAPAASLDPVQALAAARYALADRKPADVERYLDAAAASASEEQAEEIARVRLVAAYVENFWNAVAASLKSLQPGMEFKYDDEPAVLVDNADGVVTVRVAGQNREVNANDLPTKLSIALAEHWMDKNDPANKLALGAFLTVAPKGDREKARALWLQAELSGLDAEVALVMPELSVKYPTEPVAVSLPTAAPPTDGRGVVPPKDAQQAAREVVRQVFNDDFTAATTPPDQTVLADKLLTEGIATSDDPVKRYVLLVEARDLAVEAGDPGVVVRAIDALADLYAVDALDMKAEMLAAVAKATTGPDANAVLARTALDLADEAVLEERIDVAKALVRTALAAAKKSKDGELIKEASQRNTEVRGLKSE